MSDVKVNTSGISKVIRAGKKAITTLLDQSAEKMATEVKLSFNTGGRFRRYKRRRVVHWSSLPGSPPNVDTGSLKGSIRWVRVDEYTRRLVDGVGYGVFLEFGGRNEPRPFMRPVFERWAKEAFEQEAVAVLSRLEDEAR